MICNIIYKGFTIVKTPVGKWKIGYFGFTLNSEKVAKKVIDVYLKRTGR